MPQVEVDGLTINYEVQGEGDPLLLIHYTSADHASWAFQLPAYSEHLSCIALDLPGAGESDKPPGPYSTDGQADQVAAFLGAIGIERAHVAGMSFGAAVGMHLAVRHPRRVRSLSLHSGRHVSDDYLKIVVEQWRTLASTLPTVADVVIQAIFPWCFTPEMYVQRPEFVDTLVEFVRSRPAQPVDAFMAQTDAVPAHDASAALGEINVPTLITFGAPRRLSSVCAACRSRRAATSRDTNPGPSHFLGIAGRGRLPESRPCRAKGRMTATAGRTEAQRSWSAAKLAANGSLPPPGRTARP